MEKNQFVSVAGLVQRSKALRVLPAETRLTVHRQPRVWNLFCYAFCLRHSYDPPRHPDACWNVSIDVIRRLYNIKCVPFNFATMSFFQKNQDV